MPAHDGNYFGKINIILCLYTKMKQCAQTLKSPASSVMAPSSTTLRRKAETLSKLFRGLSDSSRLSILEALRPTAQTVGEIVHATGLTQPNVSNHLGCLYDCGLVARDHVGRFVRYRLSDPRVETLLRLAEELLADTARGVLECTELDCRKSTP